MHKLIPTVLLANFRTSMYRERNDGCRSRRIMNSSAGNIPGQMQVPMEDSPIAATSAARSRGGGMGAISAMITSIIASTHPMPSISAS